MFVPTDEQIKQWRDRWNRLPKLRDKIVGALISIMLDKFARRS